MTHYFDDDLDRSRCGEDGDTSEGWADVSCMACIFRDAKTLPARPKAVQS